MWCTKYCDSIWELIRMVQPPLWTYGSSMRQRKVHHPSALQNMSEIVALFPCVEYIHFRVCSWIRTLGLEEWQFVIHRKSPFGAKWHANVEKEGIRKKRERERKQKGNHLANLIQNSKKWKCLFRINRTGYCVIFTPQLIRNSIYQSTRNHPYTLSRSNLLRLSWSSSCLLKKIKLAGAQQGKGGFGDRLRSLSSSWSRGKQEGRQEVQGARRLVRSFLHQHRCEVLKLRPRNGTGIEKEGLTWRVLWRER